MTLANLGMNNDSINYEVALEVLGQKKQPFIRAIAEEMEKPNPSAELVAYCKARKHALSMLQDDLRLEDKATINAILDKENPLFWD